VVFHPPKPGQATYDYNSYHHIGAWPHITGPLRAGDVALGYGAQAKYHVQPGQMFTDEYGRSWRFADRSGSKDPYNVDVFKGATGGIVHQKILLWVGEEGPEAVIPLRRTPRSLSLLDKTAGALGVSNSTTGIGPFHFSITAPGPGSIGNDARGYFETTSQRAVRLNFCT